jgi:hypothetical protein
MRKWTRFKLLSVLTLLMIIEATIAPPSWALCCRCLYAACDTNHSNCLAAATSEADRQECEATYITCVDNVDVHCGG